MFESMSFTYDGISSEDFGVMMINSGTGLFKEPFLANRSIIEKTIAWKNVPLLTRVEEKPLSFPLTIFVEEWEKRNNLRAIARWLNQIDYKPLWFESNPDKIVYALIDGASQLIHNGLQEGYITLNVRCKTHHFHSHPRTYLKTVNGSAEDYINNDGDEDFAPFLEIKKRGNGNVKIETYMEGQKINTFEIKNMLDGEVAYVNCRDEQIRSSYANNERYLYDLFNNDYLVFTLGNIYNTESSTKIVFTGNFDFKMDYETIYRSY